MKKRRSLLLLFGIMVTMTFLSVYTPRAENEKATSPPSFEKRADVITIGSLRRFGGLERPEVEEQKLLRAARWLESEDHDVAALAEDGNLQIVDWIDATGRDAIEDLIARGRSRLVEVLLAEYTGPAS